MITDVILTQGAALLATIQLNCTAPQIQVVDERPWPGAYFRTIEDQNIIWMKRSAAESGHCCADANSLPILLDQWQRGSNSSTSNSRLLTSSKGVSNSTYCFRKLLKNQSWKPDCERAHCRGSSPGRYAGRAPRRMASQGWTTIRRTCLEIGKRARESQLRCSRTMPRQQAELLQLAQRAACSASKPGRARTSWRAAERGSVHSVRVLCRACE